MTPNLIRSFAAACLAAALVPAQEEREVVIQLQEPAGAESAGKAATKHKATHRKMMKIIERLSDDGVSSAERQKLKKALIKMIGDGEKNSSRAAYAIVTDVPFGDGKTRYAKTVIGKPGKPGEYARVIVQGPGTKSGKAKDSPQPEWFTVVRDGTEQGVWVTDGTKAHGKNGLIYELNKTIGKGQGQGGKKKSSSKGADLKKRATQLRARLDVPNDLHEVVTLLETGDGSPIIRYRKAGDATGAGGEDEIDVKITDDGEVHVIDGKGKRLPRYLKTGQQDPKKSRSHAGDYVRVTVCDENGKVKSYTGSSKDNIEQTIQMLLRRANGKAKEAGKATADGFTLEWTTDTGMDVFQHKGDGKAKKGDRYTFDVEGDLFDARDLKARSNKSGAFVFHSSEEDETDSKKGKKRTVKWVPALPEDKLLKLLHDQGADVRKDVAFDVHVEQHGEHGEHGQHAEQHEEHGDDSDVLEMIREMRAEMRELREMMQQIRKNLGNSKATAGRARRLPLLIRETSAEPVRRVRRRETR